MAVYNTANQAGCFNCLGCSLGEVCRECAGPVFGLSDFSVLYPGSRGAQIEVTIAGVVAAGESPCSDCADANGTFTLTTLEDSCIQEYCQWGGAGPTFCGVTWQLKVSAVQFHWVVSLFNPNYSPDNCVVWTGPIGLTGGQLDCTKVANSTAVQLNALTGCDFSASTVTLTPSEPQANTDYDFVASGDWTDHKDGTWTLNSGPGTLAGRPNSNPQNPNAPVPSGLIMVRYDASYTGYFNSVAATIAGQTYTVALGKSVPVSTPVGTIFTLDPAGCGYTAPFGCDPNSTATIRICQTFNNYILATFSGSTNGTLATGHSAIKLPAEPGIPDWSIGGYASGGPIIFKNIAAERRETLVALEDLNHNQTGRNVACNSCAGNC